MKLRSLLGIFACAAFVVGCSQTDAGITTSVKSKLTADDLVKARNIDVDTKDHVVTLNGTVQSPEEEAQALQIARGTKGVTSVVDNINVEGPERNAAPTSGTESMAPGTMAPGVESNAPATGTMDSASRDAELNAQVKAALMSDTSFNGQAINVESKDGVVTLTGNVRNAGEKTKAVEAAGKVSNVIRVDDKLTVK